MTESIIYCIDSSALIDLRLIYRRHTFPALWKDVSELVRAARLIAPSQVWTEIRNDDVLPDWVREAGNRKMFRPLNAHALQIAREIVQRFAGLVDPDKEIPDADPFVIALAAQRNLEPKDLFRPSRCVVVTSERFAKTGKPPKIPDVCRHMQVDCMCGERALADLFEREGWHYK